jgi:hypothetical protein
MEYIYFFFFELFFSKNNIKSYSYTDATQYSNFLSHAYIPNTMGNKKKKMHSHSYTYTRKFISAIRIIQHVPEIVNMKMT